MNEFAEARSGENPEKKNGTPFVGDFSYIKPTRVAELPGMENKVIRKEWIGGGNIGAAIARFNRTKSFLSGWSKKYNIAMPEFDFVVGRDEEGETSIFTVVDKIEGSSLDTIRHLPAETLPQFDELYESLLQAEFDAYINKTPIMWDDADPNLTYGHRNGEKESRPYFHDIEPFSVLFPDNPPGQEHDYQGFVNGFRKSIELFEEDLASIEQKFSGKVRLERARKKAAEILNYLRKSKKT